MDEEEVVDYSLFKSEPGTQMELVEGYTAQRKAMLTNHPFITPNYDPADVSKVMEHNNKLRAWGRADRPKTNEAIERRIDEYLFYCQEVGAKPTVEGLGLALGYTRMTLNNWKRGVMCDKERQEIIAYAYDIFASFDADMVINGKLYAVPYIFRAKNYYDMKDQTEMVVTPNNPLGEGRSAEEIAEQYSFLPEE